MIMFPIQVLSSIYRASQGIYMGILPFNRYLSDLIHNSLEKMGKSTKKCLYINCLANCELINNQDSGEQLY